MSTLEQIKSGLGRALEGLGEGWQHLRERATHALTRFNPVSSHKDMSEADERRMRHGARWGLLAADMEETADALVVRLEVPGLDKDAFDIFVDDDILVVRGEKRVEREGDEGRYHILECAYGRFERAVALPLAVDQDGARARYRDGVLRIELPKARAGGQRRIEVREG